MRLTALRIALVGFALMACDIIGPRPLCGCSPATGGTAIIAGTVVDPSNAVVVGALVTKELLPDAPCLTAAVGALPATALTTSNGRFAFSNSWEGGDKCWRLWARAPVGSALTASDSILVNVAFTAVGAKPDSVELLLRLR